MEKIENITLKKAYALALKDGYTEGLFKHDPVYPHELWRLERTAQNTEKDCTYLPERGLITSPYNFQVALNKK